MAQQAHAAAVVVGVLLYCCLCLFVGVVAGEHGGGGGDIKRQYKAMFSFGDSLTDTGNICVNMSAVNRTELTMAQPPYGITFFGHPTCRCSDGRLVVDFLGVGAAAAAAVEGERRRLPIRRGANMAIVGGTALDFEFFESIGVGFPFWNYGSMNVQLRWFRDLLPSICATAAPQGCRAYLAESLFLFGSLGGNDYNAMVLFGFTVDQARNYTPKIVDQIESGVEKLIAMGAVDIVVPGVMPFGCFALYLTELKSSNKSDYDDYGCLKPLNDLAIHHNSLLQTSLAAVQARHCRSPPSSPPAAAVRIMYADYYAVVAEMMQTPARLGFRSGIAACCGAGGGEYNWEYEARCGMRGAAACADPSSAVCWDGAHTTEAANRVIAGGWLRGPYCHPPILH
uniref:Esterase n=1 Tax=Oryza meridionalis TaxID=40149 RepID=A0A0E0DW40_9ORYZ